MDCCVRYLGLLRLGGVGEGGRERTLAWGWQDGLGGGTARSIILQNLGIEAMKLNEKELFVTESMSSDRFKATKVCTAYVFLFSVPVCLIQSATALDSIAACTFHGMK